MTTDERKRNREAQKRWRLRTKLGRKSYVCDADDAVLDMLINDGPYLTRDGSADKHKVSAAISLFLADAVAALRKKRITPLP